MLWIYLCFFSCSTAHWTLAKRWESPKRRTAHCPEQWGGYHMVCVLAASLWLSSTTPTLMSLSYESLTGQYPQLKQPLKKSVMLVMSSRHLFTAISTLSDLLHKHCWEPMSNTISGTANHKKNFFEVRAIMTLLRRKWFSQCLQSSVCCGPCLAQPGALWRRKRPLCWRQLCQHH